MITRVTPMRDLRQWENGGYFVLRPEIFDELNEGEDLVEDAIVRLVVGDRVMAYPYKGYWSPADTVKERAQLDERYPGRLPVDDLGSGTLGRGHLGGRRSAQSPLVRTPRWSLRLGGGDIECCRCIWRRQRKGPCRCSPSAPTPMTSRSAPAGPC